MPTPRGGAVGRSKALRLAGAVALVLALFFIVLAPLSELLIASFRNPSGSGWTLANYVAAFDNARHLRALWNSVLLGIFSTALCLVFALPVAWFVSRTDMPCRGLARLTVMLAFVTPSYLGGVAWILLGAPRAGWLNRAWRAVTDSGSDMLNIYSFGGLIFVVAIYAYPYIFVFTTAAIDMVPADMEEASRNLGAGRLRTTLLVTLPLVLPAILAGAIVTFLDTIALFGTPALIAIPAHFSVMTTQLWNFFEYPVRVEVAAAYSVPLLLITALLLGLQRRMLRRKSFVTVSGEGGARRVIPLGGWRWVALLYVGVVGLLSVYLPIVTIAEAAFSKAWGRGFSLANLTAGNFRYLLFTYPTTQQAIVNTIAYSGLAATACVALALTVAYVVHRRLMPMGQAVGLVVMAPFVVPGIVLGIAFYATYAPPPAALNGTAWIVVLAFITRFLPIAYAGSHAAIQSINVEMEDAARILGAGRTATVRSIVVPLLKTSLLGAWLMVFIAAARELSTAVFVVGPQTHVLSMVMLDLSEEGNFENLAASGCILLVLMLATVGIGYGLLGKDFLLQPQRN